MTDKYGNLLNGQYMLSCFLNLLAMMVHFMCLISFPVYVLEVLKGDPAQAGLLTSCYIFTAMLMRPVSAPILSTLGKKKSMLIGAVIIALAAVGYTLGAAMLTLLFVLRICAGVGFGLQQLALNTTVLDFVPPARKAEGLGNFSMFMNVASAISPMLSLGIAKAYSFPTLFSICIGLGIVIFILTLGLKPTEFVKSAVATVTSSEPKSDEGFVSKYFEPKAFKVGILAALAFAICYTTVTTFFAPFARKIPTVAPYFGYFYIVVTVATVLLRPFFGRIIDKKGGRYAAYPGFIALALGFFTVSRMDSPALMFFAAICFGIAYSSIFAAAQSGCVKSTTPERAGHANITFFFLFDLGYALGAYIFGLVAKATDFYTMYSMLSVVAIVWLVLYFLFIGRTEASKMAART